VKKSEYQGRVIFGNTYRLYYPRAINNAEPMGKAPVENNPNEK